MKGYIKEYIGIIYLILFVIIVILAEIHISQLNKKIAIREEVGYICANAGGEMITEEICEIQAGYLQEILPKE